MDGDPPKVAKCPSASKVAPGALLLLVSGTWMIVKFYGGWDFLQMPWLAGMVGWFAFEFIEGNTITRLFFHALRRLTRSALRADYITPNFNVRELVPTFTHFLDLPILFLIIALGADPADNLGGCVAWRAAALRFGSGGSRKR